MMKVLYACDYCGSIFQTEEEARGCERNKPPDFTFEINQRVLVERYGRIWSVKIVDRRYELRTHRRRYQVAFEGSLGSPKTGVRYEEQLRVDKNA